MKRFMRVVMMLWLAGVFSMAQAANTDSDDEKEKQRAELELARKQLNEAARRVGELSRELGEGYFFSFGEDGEPRERASLGITISNKEIQSVTPGGPADKAGLRSGDILVAIDKVKLGDDRRAGRELIRYLSEKKPGDVVTIEYQRDGKPGSAKVTTDAMPMRVLASRFDGPLLALGEGIAAAPGMPPRAMTWMAGEPFLRIAGDMELVTITPDLGKYFGTDKGLLVARAPSDDQYRLKAGDVILAIGGRTPNDPRHAIRILRSYEPGEKVKLDIMREQKRQTLEIVIPELPAEHRSGFRMPGDDGVIPGR